MAIIKLLVMGSSVSSPQAQNIDPNIQIYITLNKLMYYVGQIVEGSVHINFLDDRPYQQLNVIIQGEEHVYWAPDSQTTYTSQRATYHAQMNLANFNLGIRRGQYSFPFSILLPRAFPASLNYDAGNYIKYEIAAQLNSKENFTFSQVFKRLLHIRQPPRGIRLNLKREEQCTAELCGCCCNCGSVYMSLQADTNYIQCGKPFYVRGLINNQSGQININNYKIVLRERVKKMFQYSCHGQQVINRDFLLYDARKPVPKAVQEPFHCQIKIPRQFTGYTAIGNIIYRAYFLTLIAEVSDCASNPTLEVHTILLNSLLHIQQPNFIREIPMGWNPVTAEPLAFVNLPPYVYMPSPLIDVRNQDGQVAGPMMYEMPPASNRALYPS